MTLLCLPKDEFNKLPIDAPAASTVLNTNRYLVSIDSKVRARELRDGAWWVITIGEDGEFGFDADELRLMIAWLMDEGQYRQSWSTFQALAVILYNSEEEALHFWIPGNSYLSVFYSIDKGHYFSSRIYEIASLVGGEVKCPSELEFLLCYQFLPGTDTHFSNILKAGAGQIIDFNIGKQRVEVRPKKEVIRVERYEGLEDGIIHELHTDFLSALDQQTSGFDRVGVLLGGFDSALIVSGLKQLGKATKGYTFRYDLEKYNQRHVDDIIEEFQIAHEWIRISQEDIVDGITSYSRYFDQPTSQPHYLVNTLKAARAIEADGIDLCLTGDGCDGVFFGYPTVYRKYRLLSQMNKAPGILYKGLAVLLSSITLEKLLGHPYRMARHITQALCREPEIINFLTAAVIDSRTFEGLWGRGYSADSLDEVIYTCWLRADKPDPIHAAYLGKNMVGLNKAKLSSCFNETGITLKTPYLHPLVSQYADKLSSEHWISNKERKVVSGKYLLSRMAIEKSMLSEEIVHQPKMSPVSSPMDYWLKTSLREEMLEFVISRDASIDKNFVNSLLREKTVESLYKRFATIDDYTSHVLGLLTSYLSYGRHED